MEYFYDWVKSIIVFMVFITVLSNLFAKSDFKKYLNVVTGLLMVLITISPILKLFRMDQTFGNRFDANVLYQDTKEIETELRQASSNQQNLIIEQYKERIKDQVSNLLLEHKLYLLSIRLDIETDMEKENFGRLQSMNVIATYSADSKERTRRVESIEIDRVEITNDQNPEEKKKKEKQEFMSAQEINIKNILADFYNIEADNINISIRGGQEGHE